MTGSPTYLGVWCPTCKQDCLPMHDNTCGFCGNRVDQPAACSPPAAEPQPKESLLDTCKVDGCANQSAGKGGPWKGMCDQHISSEISRRHAKRAATMRDAKTAKPATNGTHVAAPIMAVSLIASAERLRDLAERLDALRAETASVEQALKDAYAELGQLV